MHQNALRARQVARMSTAPCLGLSALLGPVGLTYARLLAACNLRESASFRITATHSALLASRKYCAKCKLTKLYLLSRSSHIPTCASMERPACHLVPLLELFGTGCRPDWCITEFGVIGTQERVEWNLLKACSWRLSLRNRRSCCPSHLSVIVMLWPFKCSSEPTQRRIAHSILSKM